MELIFENIEKYTIGADDDDLEDCHVCSTEIYNLEHIKSLLTLNKIELQLHLNNKVTERRTPIGRKLTRIKGYVTKKGAIHTPTQANRAFNPNKDVMSPVRSKISSLGIRKTPKTINPVIKKNIEPKHSEELGQAPDNHQQLKDNIRQQKEELSGVAAQILKMEPKFKKFGVDGFWDKYAVATGKASHEIPVYKQMKEKLDKLYATADEYALSKDSKYVDDYIDHEVATMVAEGRPTHDVEEAKKAHTDGALRKKLFSQLQKPQIDEISKWVEHLNGSDYNPSFKYAILNEVLTANYDMHSDKQLKRNSETLRGITPKIKKAVDRLYNEYDGSGKLLKKYTEIMSSEVDSSIGKKIVKSTEKGDWVKFNSTEKDPRNADENVELLTAMVQDTPWCTKYSAKTQLSGGDFYIFKTKDLKNKNKARIAIKMEGNDVDEVRGIMEGQTIEESMLDSAKDFLKNDIRGGDKWIKNIEYNKRISTLNKKIQDNTQKLTSDDIDELEYLMSNDASLEYENQHKENLKYLLKEPSLKADDKSKYNYKKIIDAICKKYDYKPYNIYKDPTYTIDSEHKYALTNIDIDNNVRNIDFNIEKVLGDVNVTELEPRPYNSGRNMDIDYEYETLDSFDSLKFIGGNLKLGFRDYDKAKSQIRNLGGVEFIGGDLSGSTNLESIGNLKHVGGNMNIANSYVRTLGDLEYVGGKLSVGKNLKDFGKIERVGALFVKEGNYKSLGNIKYIDGDAEFKFSSIDTLGNVERIGGDMVIENSRIKSTGNLKTVDGDWFSNVSIDEFPNLKSVNGEIIKNPRLL